MSARVAARLRAQARALELLADELERQELPPAPAAVPVDDLVRKRAEKMLRRRGLWIDEKPRRA